MGMTYEPTRVREVAERAIRQAVQSKDNPADLADRGGRGGGRGVPSRAPLKTAANTPPIPW